ncbi:GNAT family N-acetyltransferase [Amylibacter sp. SFDW26]|uniref:GNAT family N-acetyltransferase n=1 Tax=Amylibacter sp. SFDW26 TaxID=2652722 RepID=UPI0012620793|nr:GNAT family N-acetyltransferase [Amylibacter sp. SFDW26]KAB7614591.1 GNAT family N-acetyltransferase [Amylibacter sp. SFDW26]
MQKPTSQELFSAVDATWSAKQFISHDGWMLREGAGGGKRVSAATLEAPIDDVDIIVAEQQMTALGQKSLFMVRDSDAALDNVLEQADYGIVDPVVVLASPVSDLLKQKYTSHSVNLAESPSNDAKTIWNDGGISPDRLSIMERVTAPKTILESSDMGVAFVAAHKGIAMVHAVEVSKDHRRKGVANALMYKAALWAKDHNCNWLAVLTVRENVPACTLYQTLGMTEAAAYHYRFKRSV